MANIEMLLKEKVYESEGMSELHLTEYIEVYRIISDGLELYEIIDRNETNKSSEGLLTDIGSGSSIAHAFRNAIENTPDVEEKLEIVTAEAKCHELYPEMFNKYDEQRLLHDVMYYCDVVELLERDDDNE